MTATDCPQILESVEVFKGRVFSVSVDKVREGGRVHERETVRHAGSAVVIPVFDDGTDCAGQAVSASDGALPF